MLPLVFIALADLDTTLLDLADALVGGSAPDEADFLKGSDDLLLRGRPLLGPGLPVEGASLAYADLGVVFVV
jgi:hypothetical protein